MSFSQTTKIELSKIRSHMQCCQKAELAALIRSIGALHIHESRKLIVTMDTQNSAVARRIFQLIKQLFGFSSEIIIRRQSLLKKSNVYQVRIDDSATVGEMLDVLKLRNAQGFTSGTIDSDFTQKECCRRAYLRGAFLGSGSLSNPEKTYHLEITDADPEYCLHLQGLIGTFELKAGISQRKHGCVVYIKEAEGIVTFLNIIGAHTALLDLESLRVFKDVRNSINRLVNCETANLSKTVSAAVDQMETIRYLDDWVGLDELPRNLREIALLRLQYPEVSLKELGEMLEPPLGKSGVRHRMDRLRDLADELRIENKGMNKPGRHERSSYDD
jgi:hypothetical protein